MCVKNDQLKDLYENFVVLVDEFHYEKNSIEDTKDFMKYLLFEFYWQATKPDYKKFNKDTI